MIRVDNVGGAIVIADAIVPNPSGFSGGLAAYYLIRGGQAASGKLIRMHPAYKDASGKRQAASLTLTIALISGL